MRSSFSNLARRPPTKYGTVDGKAVRAVFKAASVVAIRVRLGVPITSVWSRLWS